MFYEEECEEQETYDLNDIYSDEERDQMKKIWHDKQFHSPVSMDSLGLSWRDFF